jgi:hypothetical protein
MLPAFPRHSKCIIQCYIRSASKQYQQLDTAEQYNLSTNQTTIYGAQRKHSWQLAAVRSTAGAATLSQTLKLTDILQQSHFQPCYPNHFKIRRGFYCISRRDTIKEIQQVRFFNRTLTSNGLSVVKCLLTNFYVNNRYTA